MTANSADTTLRRLPALHQLSALPHLFGEPEEPKPTAMAEATARQLLARRILLLDGALDDQGGTRLCGQLFLLSAEDAEADISLWINSPGGSVAAMLAIMDTMRLIPNDVSTLALGIACSAGQFLLTAGTPGKRFALPHSRILMHQGSAGIGGTAVDIELQADDLRLTRDVVLGEIARNTGQRIEKIFEDSQRDRWYTAEQAVDYGFVDHIVADLSAIRPGLADLRGGKTR
jgi:ATP-dependent Clp protease protease subunit